jgi:hypothetical protein
MHHSALLVPAWQQSAFCLNSPVPSALQSPSCSFPQAAPQPLDSYPLLQVTETPSLMLLPNSLLQRFILSPLRYQTAGTILAAGLAVQRGWAINLGGGFHHSCWNQGRAW